MITYEINDYVSNDNKLIKEISQLEKDNKYLIIEKGSTGLGATTHFITRNTSVPQIIIIHSRGILEDKSKQHTEKNKFFLFGGSKDRFHHFERYYDNNKTLCLTPEQFEIHKDKIKTNWKIFIDEIDSLSEGIGFREDIKKLLISSQRFDTVVVSSATFTIINNKFRDIPFTNPPSIKIIKKNQKPIPYNLHNVGSGVKNYIESLIMKRERPLIICTNDTRLIESFCKRDYVNLLVGETMMRKSKILQKAIEISEVDWTDNNQVLFMSSRYLTGVDVMFNKCDVVIITNPRSKSKMISYNMMRQFGGRPRINLCNIDIIIDHSKPLKPDTIDIKYESYDKCVESVDNRFELVNFIGTNPIKSHYNILEEELEEYNHWVIKSNLVEKLKEDNNMILKYKNTLQKVDFSTPKVPLIEKIEYLDDTNTEREITIDLDIIRRYLDNKHDENSIGYSLKKHWLPNFITYVCKYTNTPIRDIVSQVTYEPLMIYDFNEYVISSQIPIEQKERWKSFIGWYKVYLNKPKKKDNKSMLESSRIMGKYRKKEKILLDWRYDEIELEILIMESYPRTEMYEYYMDIKKSFEPITDYKKDIYNDCLRELSEKITLSKEIKEKIQERISSDTKDIMKRDKLPIRSIQTPYNKLQYIFEELINGGVNNLKGKTIDNRIYNAWTNISKRSLHFVRQQHPNRFISLDVKSAYVRFVDIELGTNVYKEVYSNIMDYYKCSRDKAKKMFNTFLNNGRNIDGNRYEINKSKKLFKIASGGKWTDEHISDLMEIITNRTYDKDKNIKYNTPFLKFSKVEKQVIKNMTQKIETIYLKDKYKKKLKESKENGLLEKIKPIRRKHDEIIIDNVYLNNPMDDTNEEWRFTKFVSDDDIEYDIEFNIEYI